MNLPLDKLLNQVAQHPYPLVFATISGAHLYGFPSDDSDFDLRGIHLLPLQQVVGIDIGEETVEKSGIHDGLEIDLVTHDARKFFAMILKRNGYVLEQIFSPLVVSTTEAHAELKSIAESCITKHHAHHYMGFAATQWTLFRKEEPLRVKPLLYVFRVLLTGIHLMQSGRVVANVLELNEQARLSYVDDLVQCKRSGPEQATLKSSDVSFYESEYHRLMVQLEESHQRSELPDQPRGKEALNALLIRLRLG